MKKRRPVVGQPDRWLSECGHQLVGLLGGGVDADRVIDAVVLGERRIRVLPPSRLKLWRTPVLRLVVAAALKICHKDPVTLLSM